MILRQFAPRFAVFYRFNFRCLVGTIDFKKKHQKSKRELILLMVRSKSGVHQLRLVVYPTIYKNVPNEPRNKKYTHTQLLFLCWQLIDPSMRLGVADSFCSTKPWIIGSSKCLFGVKMKVKGHGPSTLQKFKGFFVNLLQQNKIRTSTTRHDTSWNMTSSCSFLWGEEHFAKSLEKVHKLTRYSVQNTHRKIENRCI